MRLHAEVGEAAVLWWALLLAGAAWSAHLILAHFLVEGRCAQLAGSSLAASRAAGVDATLLVATLVAALLALTGALLAWMQWRAFRRDGAGLGRDAGLAAVVGALALFFVVLIVVQSVPLWLLGCVAG